MRIARIDGRDDADVVDDNNANDICAHAYVDDDYDVGSSTTTCK
jgi:hypothetical protein